MSYQSDSQDRHLSCVECGEQFDWTAGEQDYFREKGLSEAPKRCKSCRQAKRARFAERDDHGPKAA